MLFFDWWKRHKCRLDFIESEPLFRTTIFAQFELKSAYL